MRQLLFSMATIALLLSCGKESGVSKGGCGSAPVEEKPPPSQMPLETDRPDKLSFPSVASGEWSGASGNVNETASLTGIWSSGGPLVIAVGEGYVYRSTNRGAQFLRSGAAAIQGRSPVVWGLGNEVYVGGGAAMYRSTDGGSSFEQTSSTSMTTIQAIHGLSSDAVFAAGAQVIVRTTDHGASWKHLTLPLKSGWLYGLTSTDDKSALFVSGKEDGPKKTSTGMQETNAVIFRSTDKGDSWERLPMFEKAGTDFEESRQVCFTNGILFAASSYALFMTRDLGKTWRTATSVGTEVLALACRGKEVMVGGRNRALFISRDLGTTWKEEKLPRLFTHAAFVSVESLAIGNEGEAFVGFESLYDVKKASLFRRNP